MRTGRLALLCVAFAILSACGSSSPAGPSDGASPGVLEGRTVNAIDGAALPGVSVAVGARNTTADSNGYFRVDVGGPSTYNMRVRGNTIVDRETVVTGPGTEPARVSLIPSTFDLDSFDQMFRPNGGLQRWTARPSLVVLASVMSYANGARDEYSATGEQMTEEEVTLLIAHLTEGLSTLTSGTFTSFASVEIERPAAGARASVTRPGKIVMGRYNGIVSLANTIGYGQWALTGDGSVGGGAMFLDRDFDKNDGRRRLLRIHELGHALGLMHVTNRPSIMNPSLGPDVTDFDRSAASIAFQRPAGNHAPDIDPSGAPGIRSTDRRTLEWAPPVFCR
jgi:matrixin